ncbi:iron-containing alcohol dehydrogenase [Bacillus sp. FJAT-50079]|uniref:iron-containing alcohol dehydrogenase n=1 Tax=Bacillus sp. FJAT-50079 TaxID=2833577 RepID=UPI001BC9D6A8|nr:iron-containing alcohol dehydrogenase [Bacillus sp. FJAT-50079]MBS4210579.1 iron-containing alcohol dehydrogenase [Bacillus sp. FJAT-50079]
MQQIYRFQPLQTVFYGNGSIRKLGELARKYGTKAMIISDSIMEGLGYVNECKEILDRVNIRSSLYLGVNSEPTDHYVKESLAQLIEEKCDLVISIGGGSCIDTAKAISILATNPGYIGEFIGSARIAEQTPLPHIAIPTTAGTGSEATDVTVISAMKTDVKMMIKQPAFLPVAAIVDPLLTMSAPKSVTAATGLDALTHAIEAYISTKAQPLTDMFAIAAMENIIPAIKTVYKNGDDHDARGKMALGSMLAGIAFSNSSVCLVHGMSRPIGALFHVPHGMSNAMLLPVVLEYSMEHCIDRLAVIGKMFADEDARGVVRDFANLAVEKIKELTAYLNIPNPKEWGIEDSVYQQALPKMARDALASGSPQNNPRVPTTEEIIELYKLCYSYNFTKKVNN